MDGHFLTDIEIKQFKCFTDFKAAGFKRVNLIGGKNNVGKTAFMEACYINVYSSSINGMVTAIRTIQFMRKCLSFIWETHKDKTLLDATISYVANSNLKNCSFSIQKKDAVKEYQFIIDGQTKIINNAELTIVLEFIEHINFIDSLGWDDYELINAYQAIQKADQESELDRFIQEFDNSIANFKAIGDKPQCKTNGEYRDITEFGDGLKHYISIICALYTCENGYLFIDEIDNGIHYSQLDRLWEIILTLSKKTNCQVFASTHSKEMLEAFARVATKLDEQDISYTTLVKNPQQELKAITRDYKMLLDSIEQEREVRGW